MKFVKMLSRNRKSCIQWVVNIFLFFFLLVRESLCQVDDHIFIIVGKAEVRFLLKGNIKDHWVCYFRLFWKSKIVVFYEEKQDLVLIVVGKATGMPMYSARCRWCALVCYIDSATLSFFVVPLLHTGKETATCVSAVRWITLNTSSTNC